MKKDYVRIHSNMSIGVAPGLHYEDVTKKGSDIPNRLKVNPAWPKMAVNSEAGSHIYPAEIAEWPSVLALQKDKILTIGDFCDETGEADKAAVEIKRNVNEEIKRFKDKVATKKDDVSLNDIASD